MSLILFFVFLFFVFIFCFFCFLFLFFVFVLFSGLRGQLLGLDKLISVSKQDLLPSLLFRT